MKKFCLMCLFLGMNICGECSAQEFTHTDCMDRLKSCVDSYVTKKLDKSRISSFNKRIDEKINESSLSEQARMNQIIFDWCSDHKGKFENKSFSNEELAEGCLLLNRCFIKNLDIPKKVMDEFTDNEVGEFCDFLESKLKDSK